MTNLAGVNTRGLRKNNLYQRISLDADGTTNVKKQDGGVLPKYMCRLGMEKAIIISDKYRIASFFQIRGII